MKYLDRKFITQFLTNDTDKKIIFNSEALLIPTGILTLYLMGGGIEFLPLAKITPVSQRSFSKIKN